MGVYGDTAVEAVRLYNTGKVNSPIDAWNIAAEAYVESTSGICKGCPKSAFLGLCEDGIITGIPSSGYTQSKDNKIYALKAVELIKKDNNLTKMKDKLWNLIGNEGKKQNSQLDVVISLWNTGLIN